MGPQTTTIYERPTRLQRNNTCDAGMLPGTITTGAAFWRIDQPDDFNVNGFNRLSMQPESETLMFTSDGSADYWFTPMLSSSIGYFVVSNTDVGFNSWPIVAFDAMPKPEPRLITYCVRVPEGGPEPAEVRSLASQRREREATAELAGRIESLVPEFSDADLGRLAGVSRITWRAWKAAETVARRGSRQRLLRLERILMLRASTDPDTPLSHWLDSPIGEDVDTTPAKLLAEGRDNLVAVLATRMRMSLPAGPRVEMPEALHNIVTSGIDDAFADRRGIYAEDDDDAK